MNTKSLAPALVGSIFTAALFAAYLYWHDAENVAQQPSAVTATATPSTAPEQSPNALINNRQARVENTAPPVGQARPKLAALPDFLPPGMGLVGTATTGAQPSASFVIDGRLYTLGLGSSVPGTVLVIKSIQDSGVQLGFANGNDSDLYNVKTATAAQIAQLNADARSNLSNSAASTAAQPRPASDLIVLKDANSSVPLVDEMKITVRRRKLPTGGPVEVL